MRARIRRRDERPRPVHAQHVPLVSVVLPDAFGIHAYRVRERVVGRRLVQQHEIARKHAFELRAVGAAVGAARVMQDAVGVGQLGEGGFGNAPCEREVCSIGGGAVELYEAAEDDALVVGPGCLRRWSVRVDVSEWEIVGKERNACIPGCYSCKRCRDRH